MYSKIVCKSNVSSNEVRIAAKKRLGTKQLNSIELLSWFSFWDRPFEVREGRALELQQKKEVVEPEVEPRRRGEV